MFKYLTKYLTDETIGNIILIFIAVIAAFAFRDSIGRFILYFKKKRRLPLWFPGMLSYRILGSGFVLVGIGITLADSWFSIKIPSEIYNLLKTGFWCLLGYVLFIEVLREIWVHKKGHKILKNKDLEEDEL